MTPWTADEVKTLRENYGKISAYKIAEMLGRSKSSVKSKIRTLRLNAAPQPQQSEARLLKLAVKNTHAEKPDGAGSERLERLKRLRDRFERDFDGEVVMPVQLPNFSREYRAILAEIDDLEHADERKEGAGTTESESLASAIAKLAEQQQRYMDRAAM